MQRIDKIIASQGQYSRSEVKKLIRNNSIKVNGEVVKTPKMKINPYKSEISLNGIEIIYKEFVYLILNKPKGYISATEDNNHKTVLELISGELLGRNLFPAGRLDKDTRGLMIITDDGLLAHNILSPKKHIRKIYNVELDIPLTQEMVLGFASGVELNDGVCEKSLLEITGEYTANVTLKEGRYHQVKRMFGCFGAKVLELQRIAMGNFFLPEDLQEGLYRELTDEELRLLQQLD